MFRKHQRKKKQKPRTLDKKTNIRFKNKAGFLINKSIKIKEKQWRSMESCQRRKERKIMFCVINELSKTCDFSNKIDPFIEIWSFQDTPKHVVRVPNLPNKSIKMCRYYQ